MATKYSTDLLNRLNKESDLGVRASLLCEIFKNSVIRIYTGEQPDSADDDATGTFMGNITENGEAFTSGSPNNSLNLFKMQSDYFGCISKDYATWKFRAIANGAMGWFRLETSDASDKQDSGNLYRIDGSIGCMGADMLVTHPNVVAYTPENGKEIIIDAFTIRCL